ncbi:MAG: aminotransferase class I/II-fold pyridoxal phosphate-dependent enzyme, partial [Myxococcota bacterium]
MQFLIESRRDRPADDPIFSLHTEAKSRQAAGEDVVDATIGALLHDDGTLATLPTMVEAIASVPPAVHAAYAPISGRADLRQAVVEDLLAGTSQHPRATSVITPGGSGALRMAFDDFLEPGQAVLTGSFYWGPYRTLADESGRSLKTFSLFDAAHRYDAAALDQAVGETLAEQGRCLLVLNTPCHNPPGYSLDEKEMEQTAAILSRHADTGPVTLLLDIAYGYYARDSLEMLVQAVEELSDKIMVLYAWSASKSFAQYGSRVGALVGVAPRAEDR